jgi:hypothetical protein
MTTRIFSIPMLTLLLAGCAVESAQPTLPVNHPANADAVEVAFTAPPNVLTEDVSAVTPPQDTPSPGDHSKHAGRAQPASPQAAPPKPADHADHEPKAIPVSEATQEQIDALSKAYLALTSMLTQDKVEGADDQLTAISKAAKALSEAKEAQVRAVAAKITKATPSKDGDIEAVRQSLKALSEAVIELANLAPPSKKVGATVYVAYCPHAKASWLQPSDKIVNPYYGSEMLGCGKVTGKIQAAQEHKH